MRVLLVNSNRMQPPIAPIGLDYLADALAAAGHEPRLLDLCFSQDVAADTARALAAEPPEFIGVTVRNTDDCYLDSGAYFLPEIRDLVAGLRRGSDAPIAVGGVGYSVAPGAVLAYLGADFGIFGEGEGALPALLEAQRSRTSPARVPNLIYRDAGVWRRTAPEPLDLARLPPRRRDFADNRRYFAHGGQAGFETKRGCAMKCTYCADPVAKGAQIRRRPPGAVVAELQALLAQGLDHGHTCDSEFNLPRAHALEVCHALAAAGLGGRLRWYAYCTPTPFDDELAGAMRRAGCAGINFGVDAGCDAMLQRLGRHFTTSDIARTAATCRWHRLPFMFDLLLGGPGETHATVRETLEFIRQLEPDCVGLSLGVRVYEGTALAQTLARADGATRRAALRGQTDAPSPWLAPVFYVAPEFGGDLWPYVRELVRGDRRFFLPADAGGHDNYNYNDNQALVRAIARGARGAFWDILRRLRPPV